jgi:hypothetical protein
MSQEHESKTARSARIYTRCPACSNDTLTINDDKHLLCTWLSCPDPTLIDRISGIFPFEWEALNAKLALKESELSTLREELQRVKAEAADFHVVITRDLASARKERDHALLRITKLESQLKASEKDAAQAHHAHAVTIDQLAAREEELRQARERLEIAKQALRQCAGKPVMGFVANKAAYEALAKIEQ